MKKLFTASVFFSLTIFSSAYNDSKILVKIPKKESDTNFDIEPKFDWKNFIDGCYHEFGENVFDEGLHQCEVKASYSYNNTPEPGYLNSIKDAWYYAISKEGIDVEMYKKIHAIATSHFDNVSQSVINMPPEMKGEFRSNSCSCCLRYDDHQPRIFDPFYGKGEEEKMEASAIYWYFNEFRCNYNRWKEKYISDDDKSVKEEFINKIELIYNKLPSRENYYKLLATKFFFQYEQNPLKPKIESLNQALLTVSEKLKCPPLCDFTAEEITKLAFIVNYEITNSIHIQEIVDKIFSNYYLIIGNLNQSIQEREEQENEIALKAIAETYQLLEWLHPFQDGQGRTDLIILNKLLVENGFRQPIMWSPYFSTTNILEEWVEYLRESISRD